MNARQALDQLSEEERQRIVAKAADLARKQIEKIRDTAAYKDAVRHLILASFHSKQRGVWDAIQAGVRYIAACCSRRAGKTFFLASLIVLLLLNAKFGQEVVFIAPTMKRGKELIWRDLTRIIESFHLGWKLTANIGTVETPGGALFRIVGLDNKRQVGKISRGGNTIAALCDEVQEYAHLLDDLLVGMGPALAQSRGVFIASGTPGVAEQGYWHEAAHGQHGFQPIGWTLLDNPHLGRDPEDIIREEMARNGWDDKHPTLLREYRGLWVTDSTKLVVEFLRSRDVQYLSEPDEHGVVYILNKDGSLGPAYDVTTWRHWMGVDYGFNDPTAWVVLASPPYSKNVFVFHSEQHAGFTDDQIAEKTRELVDRYRPKGIVGDSATGGPTFMASWNARYGSKYGVRMRSAKKHAKPASIKLLNTELRTERLKLVMPANDGMAKDFAKLQWADAERTKILEGAAFPEDRFDALRYALNECNAYMTKGKVPDLTEAEKELAIVVARNRAAEMEARQATG